MAVVAKFSASDADGVEHDYSVVLHGEAGIGLALELGALVVRPLGEALSRAFGSDDGIGTLISAIEQVRGGDADALATLPIGDIIAAATPGIAAAFQQVKPELVQRLFVGCCRDGKDVQSKKEIGETYRGNWTEMYMAVFHIARVNRFLPLPATLTTASGAATTAAK